MTDAGEPLAPAAAPRSPRSRAQAWAGRAGRLALVLALLGGLAQLGWALVRRGAGEPSAALHDDWHRGHRVLDRDGRLLRELPSPAELRGRELPLAALGPRIVRATLAAEDAHFATHDGVDRGALARAAWQALRHGRLVSGGSTISQQLVKLLDTQGQAATRSVTTKLREIARAQNLEAVHDKDTILAAYLHRLPYGHGLAGPQAAAQAYFGVDASALSWAQAAFLAVLPRAPSYLDPYDHQDRVVKRQRAVLAKLHELGDLDAEAYARALREPVQLRPITRPFHAPHLIEGLRARGELAAGDVTVTTLDLELQRDVEGLVRTHLASLDGLHATDAAVVVVDNASGEVLAYVGSADFHAPEIAGQVDMLRARRQPGSTLKPFVYAAAFARGMHGASLVADVPLAFVEGAGTYRPENFHRGFEGPISAREALAASLNVPAVRIAADVGPAALLELLRAFGLESLDRDAEHYGAALALGSGEVTALELATAYVALARGGERVPLRVRDPQPRDPRGQLATALVGTRVLAEPVAAAVVEAMSDPLARARLLRGRSPFDFGFPVALKTGTSSGYHDGWTAGFTHERTVVVWLGNADGAAMVEVGGANGAGPLFADVLRRAMRDVPERGPLFASDALVEVEVCALSGQPANDACTERVKRRVPRGHPVGEPSRLHRRARKVSAHPGELPWMCDPTGEAVIVVLPAVFEPWLATLPPGAPGHDPQGLPWFSEGQVRGCDADDATARTASLELRGPALGTVFAAGARAEGARIPVEVAVTGRPAGTTRTPLAIELVLDGEPVATLTHPFTTELRVGPGDHELRARPLDPTLPLRPARTRFSVR